MLSILNHQRNANPATVRGTGPTRSAGSPGGDCPAPSGTQKDCSPPAAGEEPLPTLCLRTQAPEFPRPSLTLTAALDRRWLPERMLHAPVFMSLFLDVGWAAPLGKAGGHGREALDLGPRRMPRMGTTVGGGRLASPGPGELQQGSCPVPGPAS